MGSFFTNFQVRTDDRKAVIDALRASKALPAYVTEPAKQWVSAYPEITEEQDYQVIKQIAESLSQALSKAVFALIVHDSDVFAYVLAEQGKVVDEYNSDPGYFEGEQGEPSGGNSALILPYCVAETTPQMLDSLLKQRQIDQQIRVPVNMDEWRTNAEKMKSDMVEQFELQKHNLEALGLSEEAWNQQLQAFDEYFAAAEQQIKDNGGFDIIEADDLASAFATMIGVDAERACLGFNYICEEADEKHASEMLIES